MYIFIVEMDAFVGVDLLFHILPVLIVEFLAILRRQRRQDIGLWIVRIFDSITFSFASLETMARSFVSTNGLIKWIVSLAKWLFGLTTRCVIVQCWQNTHLIACEIMPVLVINSPSEYERNIYPHWCVEMLESLETICVLFHFASFCFHVKIVNLILECFKWTT